MNEESIIFAESTTKKSRNENRVNLVLICETVSKKDKKTIYRMGKSFKVDETLYTIEKNKLIKNRY